MSVPLPDETTVTIKRAKARKQAAALERAAPTKPTVKIKRADKGKTTNEPE